MQPSPMGTETYLIKDLDLVSIARQRHFAVEDWNQDPDTLLVHPAEGSEEGESESESEVDAPPQGKFPSNVRPNPGLKR